jgi:hypothetical protein
MTIGGAVGRWRGVAPRSKTSMTIVGPPRVCEQLSRANERGEVFDALHIVMLGLCRELAEKRKEAICSAAALTFFARAP